MSLDEPRHLALPKLYGGPPYARPSVAVAQAERPFDPDELPLAVAMTDEERVLLERAAAAGAQAAAESEPGLTPRSFSLRALADRLRSTRS